MKGTKTLLSYLIFIIGLQWKTIYVASSEECSPNYFKCKKNGRCIIGAFKCDGENDCEHDEDMDYSDEENCEKKPDKSGMCAMDEFQCKNAKCILKAYTCDFTDDCGDNSDESTTDGPTCSSQETCPSDMFKCKKSGKCVYKSYVCDGEVDCGDDDDSDEKENCALLKCAAHEFKCNDYRCVDKDWVCDGSDDCGDNSDEKNCTTSKPPSSTLQPSTVSLPTKISTTIVKKTTAPGEIISANCKVFNFKCIKDDRCIHDNWICDGMNDCSDGADEKPELCKECKDDEFKCGNKTCIPKTWTCDGTPQCSNGEDENLKECDVTIPCTSSTYSCKGTDKCISQDHVCDKVKNCPNGDDESSTCGVNECDIKNGGCTHHCLDTKTGHTCACPSGYNLNSDNKTCDDINECLTPGSCSQYCKNYNGTYQCECDDGYVLLTDKKTCRAKAPLPYLIFSSKLDIREATTNFKDYKSLVKQAESSKAVDVNINEKMIYWADAKNKRISRISRDKTQPAEILVENVEPKSIAVDWIGQNLFWTDGSKIHVSKLNGQHVKTFMSAKADEKFHALAVLPEQGLLFWSDVGKNSKIESISLAGTERITLMDSGKVNKATFLSIDRNLQHLYWVDIEKAEVSASNFDGTNVRVVTKLTTSVDGLTVFEDFVYLTSNQNGEVYKLNKFSGKQVIKYRADSPNAIAIFHPLVQKKVYHPCQSINGGCSHLCFIANIKTEDFKCGCPDTMQLYKDKKTCIPKNIVEQSCNNGYQCKITKQCIPLSSVCNGVRNCIFNDDESNCPTITATLSTSTLLPSVQLQSENEEDGIDIILPIGIVIAILVLLVLIIVMSVQYRKRKRRMDLSMVFEKESNLIDGKDGKVDVEIKYIPNKQHKTTLKHKNFDNKNFLEVSKVATDNMECELMVDESDSSSDNSSEDNVLIN